MSKILTLLCFTLLCTFSSLAQNSPLGVWKTVDDQSGESKSYIRIYEENGKLYGKVTKLLQAEPDALCDQCKGDLKDQPVLGMVILQSLEPYKDYWSYGKIMDPENGKEYKCSIWLEDEDTLKVRGYIGISAMGRNQFWKRIE